MSITIPFPTGISAKKQPVTINQKHVGYAVYGTKDDDHFIGETMLKDLPNAIQKPIAIIQSQSDPSRVVVILKLEHNGKSVIAPVEVDGTGVYNNAGIDSNAITSIFAKTNAIEQIKAAIDNTNGGKTELFYWNKKEAVALIQARGLQLPNSLPQNGFVHSIHESGSLVKTKFKNISETTQFKRWFGKSKIVNEDGTPKIMYHGTASDEFWEFSPEKSGKRHVNRIGSGNYFTDVKENADFYSVDRRTGKQGRTYGVYLRLTNPSFPADSVLVNNSPEKSENV